MSNPKLYVIDILYGAKESNNFELVDALYNNYIKVEI